MSLVGFITASGVSLPNNSDTVSLTGNVDCSYVDSGTAVYIDNVLFEGIAGTSPDGSGNSTITLRNVYTGTAINSGELKAFNTVEGLRDAIRRAKNITTDVENMQTVFGDVLTSTSPTITVQIAGVDTDIVPYGYLAQQAATHEARIQALEALHP